MARCRHCRKLLDEISPGLYDECETCGLEGLWQYDQAADIKDDGSFDDPDTPVPKHHCGHEWCDCDVELTDDDDATWVED